MSLSATISEPYASNLAIVRSCGEYSILFNSFFEAQFKYCPLIRMLCSRSAKKKINELHRRAFRIVYDYCNSKFEEL